MPKQRKT
jgi:transposase-like protein